MPPSCQHQRGGFSAQGTAIILNTPFLNFFQCFFLLKLLGIFYEISDIFLFILEHLLSTHNVLGSLLSMKKRNRGITMLRPRSFPARSLSRRELQEAPSAQMPKSFAARSPEKQLSCFGDLQAKEPARQGSDHTKLFNLVTSNLSVNGLTSLQKLS